MRVHLLCRALTIKRLRNSAAREQRQEGSFQFKIRFVPTQDEAKHKFNHFQTLSFTNPVNRHYLPDGILSFLRGNSNDSIGQQHAFSFAGIQKIDACHRQ